jgi:hypothetical protein
LFAALVSRTAPLPAASAVPAQLLIGVTVLFPVAVRQGVKLDPPTIQCGSGTELFLKLSVKMDVPAACAVVPPITVRPTTGRLMPSRTVSARRAVLDNNAGSQ